MTYNDAISFYGTQEKMGAALGIAQSTISCWQRVIPPAYQYQLEIITAGTLRVDEELRQSKVARVCESADARVA